MAIVLLVCGKICGKMCGKMSGKIEKLSDWKKIGVVADMDHDYDSGDNKTKKQKGK